MQECPKYCQGDHPGLCKAIKALEDRLELHVKAIEKSIDTAKAELDRRLEAMNEFRAQLDRQSREFITEPKMESRIGPIEAKMEGIKEVVDRSSGASTWSNHIITALIGLAVIIAVWMIKGH